jgi:magnesium-transporting ATPase (P-type)
VTQHIPVREEVDCDGEAWTALEVVLLKCNVFARMSPHNKQELMRSLQDLDYVVCMTGDGANDSGALKAADIGISIASAKNVLLVEPGVGKKEEGAGAVAPIGREGDEDEERQDYDNPENAKIASEISTAEAAVTAAPSIAAPFATGLHHIGAVCTVVTEGRGTLATSFSMFKYMFLYGIIQVGL